ncbi:patatin-like phospholipase family protein [Roseomonas mucosa]|uniref:patatin-like phospholipase family protein n=1 Tax=Roseomonas mucosa TaxID=207340 RepID=UPI0028CDF2D9|nr:patatin-like phospholipase family protein [Roseomonas mucosa]MDT8353711.1 patatin-like phospholipase family protein [Roseomonas mucosa]
MATAPVPVRPENGRKPTVILALQGGGALGAYQVGAYQAMEEAGFAPDWVIGISIGAFNGALIAGNDPADRLERMAAFWQAISRPGTALAGLRDCNPRLSGALSHWEALLLGQPGFFAPRLPGPYLSPPGSMAALSFYDTAPLRGTLEGLVRFDRLGPEGGTRLSLGATDVETGELVFFDSRESRITPEHVMASGALPPACPPQRIGGRTYWDGGCVSNTPLEAILRSPPEGHCVVFVIDLWNRQGPVPDSMDGVQWRQKEIRYASRTCRGIRSLAARLDLCHVRSLLREARPELAGQDLPEEKALARTSRMDILHVTYDPGSTAISGSDAEFSRASIRERHEAGHAELWAALRQAPWTRRKPAGLAAMLHEVCRGEVRTEAGPAANGLAPPPLAPPAA